MKDFKTAIRMIKQELYILTAKQKRTSIFLFFVVLLGSAFELLGVTAILPLIEALMDLDSIREKWYLAALVDILKIEDQKEMIYVISIAVILVYLVKNVYLLWSMNVQYKFRFDFEKELSTRMLTAYLRRPYEYFLNINSAQILRGIDGDVTGVFTIYDFFFRMLAEAFNVILIGIFLIYTDWIMALGVLLLSGTCFIAVSLVFKHMLKGVGEKSRNADILKKKYAYQAVNGIKEINVMKRNEFFIQKYDDAYEISKEMERKSTFLSNCPEKIIEISCISGLIIIVCLRVAMGVDLQTFVPQLSVFAVAAFRILPSISKLVGSLNGLMYKRPALEAAYNGLREVEQYEKLVQEMVDDKLDRSCVKEVSFLQKLEIKDIVWKYPRAQKEVIRDLNRRRKNYIV